MTVLAISSTPMPLEIHVGTALPRNDLELYEFCARNRYLRVERTAEGDLLLAPPAGWLSGVRNVAILGALGFWSKSDRSGVAFGSSAGFLLPNGAMRSPDASWVLRSRLADISSEAKERFLPLCPDFVVELRSPSDRLQDLQAKMEEYRDNGARLGWLIDPQERRVHVYRPGRPAEVLDDPAEVSGDPEPPGFVLDLAPIWAPL